MDSLFWRKSNIEDPELDSDPHPWIIWYLWKACNEKLFQRIDRDLLGLIRFTEGECQAWFSANETVLPSAQTTGDTELQTICLEIICLVDRS